jgi:hypothetical protein
MAMRPTGPVAAWVLGLTSAAPFAVMAVLFCWGPKDLHGPAGRALLVYSAAIVSFMGGSRWGLEASRASPRWAVLGPGMASPLLALGIWSVTYEQPLSWRFGGFMAAFLALWLWDTIFSELPAWYSRLRTACQFIACVSLAFALENSLSL